MRCGAWHEWGLSREQVVAIISSACRYCGSQPANVKQHKNTISPLRYSGIDRIDNAAGYTEGNVVPCCRVCNRAKETLTVAEFADWVAEQIFFCFFCFVHTKMIDRG